jgi:cytochrome c biogenesis protein
MLPVDTGDGVPVFLLGMRENPGEPYRYLRPPADENGELTGFTRLRAALADPALRDRAVQRYARKVVDPQRPDLSRQLADSAARALGLFAGLEPVKGQPVAGLQALSDFLEANVPEAERSRAGEMFVRILNGTLLELDTVAREQAKANRLPADKLQGFMAQSVLALSDAPFYPATMTLMLKDFKQVQASVFQVARAPGKNVVYLGCFFLILGVFAMLYVRERRLWVWLAPQGAGAQATVALSSNRQTLDVDREFDQLTARLLGRAENTK